MTSESEPKKTETFGSLTKEEYQLEKERVEYDLGRAILLKTNAEESLEFLMNKFTYLFDYKKILIREIETNEAEIIRLKNILKI